LFTNSRETKRIKAWSDGWLAKLRDDQRRSGADLALIEADRDTIDGTAGNEGVKVVCGLRTTPLLQAVVATAKPNAHSVQRSKRPALRWLTRSKRISIPEASGNQ
jgi:hypothetical protein